MCPRTHDDADLEDYAFEHAQLPPELRALNKSPRAPEVEELNFDHEDRRNLLRRGETYYRTVRRID